MRAVLPLLLLLAIALGAPAGARADVEWLCHPSAVAVADDPCETPQDTTVIAPDGSRSVQTPATPPAADRGVDCFYVYPTVSNQLAANATKAKDPEVRAVTKFQASRFNGGCRMFAPVYRQVTTAGVLGNAVPATAQTAFADVREAWLDYLARDNGGRGVVLLGHSQGTIMLRNLIRTEIDDDPAARRRLIGAIILGGNVTTRAGSPVGGDFQRVPLCERRDQFGCVVAYSTFSTDPGATPFFGNTNTDISGGGFGLPHGDGFAVACTDPGTLSGRAGAVGLTIPTEPFPPGPISPGIAITANGPIPSADTTWVQGFQYTGACRAINGANVFRYEPVGDSRRLNEFPPTWGTHLVDFNLATDELVEIARRQTQAWLSARLSARRAGDRRVRLTLPARGRVRVTARGARARRIAVDGPATRTLRLRRAKRRDATRRTVPAARAVPIRRVRVTYRPAGAEPITRRVRRR